MHTAGPAAALDKLAAELKSRKDYAGLFYTLLMKKRFELGVSPIATGSNQDLPASAHAAFEEGIADAARTVGQLYLDAGQIPQAYGYFRMLGDTAAVAEALNKLELDDTMDVQAIIDIAFHQGVAPEKGFDWVLQRFGTCSAITVMGGELPFTPEVRAMCSKKLIRTLHHELMERLKAEIERVQNFAPSGKTVKELIAGRDFLFADDFYHIDLSHLNSVVQMSTQLDKCEELELTRDMCAYGMKLSPRFRYQSEPPFEDQYADYDKYLAILTGEDVEGGLAHFRAKVEANDPKTAGTFPAEIYINLLMRVGRKEEALDAVRKYIAPLGEVRLSCPNLVELVQQTQRYDVLAAVAREQGHAVNFLAGLIASKSPGTVK
ncbi:MAG: hypothetical protein HY289_11075 [Planctomycetes bacterium]|nr:hypothetical protein [Planctomycetota bacterium]